MESRAVQQARRSGLIEAGRPLLVMLSGGADSTCLLDVARRLGALLEALHVNYGLRAEADADEAHCRELCELFGIPLRVEHVSLADQGNLQAAARDARYAAAERHATGDYAAAHTASDQAETVLYRLVTSPGRTALLGIAARRGRLVRPLLEATREDTREHCRLAGLTWREDSSNRDPRYARTRIRHEVLPVLSELAPRAERTIALTASRLRSEAEVLEGAVDSALGELGPNPALADLRELPRALTGLVLRRLAGETSLSPDDVEAVLGLGRSGGSASIDLRGGLRAVVEYGKLRFSHEPPARAPVAVRLAIPGSAGFGTWRVTAAVASSSMEARDGVRLSAEALGDEAVVRSWRPGDRMRPVGLGGHRKLQDLFTDRKVPRELRADVPVLDAGGEIAWVVGVAVGERFQVVPGSEAVALSAVRSDRQDLDAGHAAPFGAGP